MAKGKSRRKLAGERWPGELALLRELAEQAIPLVGSQVGELIDQDQRIERLGGELRTHDLECGRVQERMVRAEAELSRRDAADSRSPAPAFPHLFALINETLTKLRAASLRQLPHLSPNERGFGSRDHREGTDGPVAVLRMVVSECEQLLNRLNPDSPLKPGVPGVNIAAREGRRAP